MEFSHFEKPRIPQVVKKFPTFVETERSLPCSQHPPLVPILRQINPVYALSSCVFKIYLYTIIHQLELLRNFLLTNPMTQSPSWEASTSSASHEMSLIVRKQKVYCRDKSPRHLSLSCASEIQSMIQSQFLKNHFNALIPYTPRSSRWSLFLGFPHQKPVYISPRPHSCYVFCHSYSSWFDHPNHFRWGVQIANILVMQSLSLLCYSVPDVFYILCFLRPKPSSISRLRHTCYTFHPSHASWIDHFNNNGRRFQIAHLLMIQIQCISVVALFVATDCKTV